MANLVSHTDMGISSPQEKQQHFNAFFEKLHFVKHNLDEIAGENT